MVKHTKKSPKAAKVAEDFSDYIESQNPTDIINDEASSSSDEVEVKLSKIITKKSVQALIKSQSLTISSSRKLLKIFKASCHINEETQTNFDSPNTLLYAIESCLKKLPMHFREQFKNKSLRDSELTSYKNLFRSFLANALFLLKQAKDNNLIGKIYKGLGKVAKYLSLFKEYIRGYLKVSVIIWGDEEKAGKLMSYNFIRKLMVKNLCDKVLVLKALYVNYAKNSKFMSWVNYSSIETMRNCFIDLIGSDLSASYQVMFTILRQQSIYLASVVKNPSMDRIKTIYNWQFLNSLILIGRTICAYKELVDLSHPLVSIISGVLSLTNIPKYFPLKLHLSRILISIQSQCKLYIPSISPNISEILMSPSLSKSANSKKLKEFSFITAIKASKEQLANELYREQLVDECTECLIEHFSSFANLTAFPECFLPIKLCLKKFCKSIKIPVHREKILHCLRVVEENSEWVSLKREEIKKINEKEYVEGDAPLKEKCGKIIKRRLAIVNSKILG